VAASSGRRRSLLRAGRLRRRDEVAGGFVARSMAAISWRGIGARLLAIGFLKCIAKSAQARGRFAAAEGDRL